ncbi:hypothetical protein [Streptomyces wedmorensis]
MASPAPRTTSWPPTSKPGYLAAYPPTIAIGTITGPARYIPDAADPNADVAVSALHIEKTLTIRCGKHRIRPAHHCRIHPVPRY